MANYYSDRKEIKFELENSPLMQRIVELKERSYEDKDQYDEAPQDFADAMDNYERVLDVVGDITANVIAPNAEDVDAEGPHSLHRLLCSRSRGAARWVRGAAGGTEARAGWGRGSERVRAPQTWSLGNVT